MKIIIQRTFVQYIEVDIDSDNAIEIASEAEIHANKSYDDLIYSKSEISDENFENITTVE